VAASWGVVGEEAVVSDRESEELVCEVFFAGAEAVNKEGSWGRGESVEGGDVEGCVLDFHRDVGVCKRYCDHL
jgi:hypothetical protein